MQWVAVLLLITALSAGAGALSSLHLMSTIQRIVDSQKEAPERSAASPYNTNVRLRKISPIVTNMAAPANTWTGSRDRSSPIR